MATGIETILGTNFLSFYGFLLPWIFTFAIVYGLLMKANLFNSASSRVNVALAFVIAFFVTGVGGPQLASFFVTLFGGTSVFLAGILVFLLFLALVGVHGDEKKGWYKGVTAFIVLLVIAVALFLSSSGFGGLGVFVDTATAALAFWVIVIIAAAWLITREGGTASTGEEPKKE